MKNLLLILYLSILCIACGGGSDTAPSDPGPDPDPVSDLETIFTSGFEEADPTSGGEWSGVFLQTPPDRDSSFLALSGDTVFAGQQSIKFYAGHEEPDLDQMKIVGGKALIFKREFNFAVGTTVEMSAMFFLPSGINYNSVFLMDLECDFDSCNDSADDQDLALGPGLQLFLREDRTIKINTSKFGDEDNSIVTAEGNTPVPLDEWFKLTWVLTLGTGQNGSIEVFINDEKDFEASGTNIKPSNLPEVDTYNIFEIGITVNRGENPATIFVDEVEIKAGS